MITDTIAAIATPPGPGGGIGIVRISGPGAVSVALSMFTRNAETISPSDFSGLRIVTGLTSHQVLHGYLFDPEKREIIDEVLLIPMISPRSYTGEDVVEIQAHSGPLVLKTILDLVLARGVRLADPGEFTRRAFLNGRIDLSQAEAVMDIIEARSSEALKIAVSQGLGHLKEVVQKARESLISLLTHIEAAIDFPDETGEFLHGSDAALLLTEILDVCQRAVRQYDDAGFLREGLKLSICGPPNVGKSSLMNRLLERERSIVTDIPGTTRDLIEEPLNINSMPFLISDTAGLHHTDDPIERIGIDRAKAHVTQSDLVLWVKDARDGGLQWEDEITALIPEGKKVIGVLNKIDRLAPDQVAALPKGIKISKRPWSDGISATSEHENKICFHGKKEEIDPQTTADAFPVCAVSAKYGQGVEGLKQTILDVVVSGVNFTSSIVPNARHKRALCRAIDALEAARQGLSKEIVAETLSIDIKNGIEALGEITGDTAGVDILDHIFSRFCIGK